MKSGLKGPQRPLLLTNFLMNYFIHATIFEKRTSCAKVKNIPDPRKIPIFAG
jgi:hypothetical protein